jgi:hypothetical protein
MKETVIRELQREYYRRVNRRRCWRERRIRIAELALAFLAAAALILCVSRPAQGAELVTPDYPECARRGPKPEVGVCPDPTVSVEVTPTPVTVTPTSVSVIIVPRVERCRRCIQSQGRTRSRTRCYGCRIVFEGVTYE